jgi:hypothetical protein
MTPLTRWNDDRLDDLARAVRQQGEQLNALVDMRVEMTSLRDKVDGVQEDTHVTVAALEKLKENLEKRAVDQAKERKADRRWMVATLLTTAGLVVAALAIFLG